MKAYTDGMVTVKVGREIAHLFNKAGSEFGQTSKEHFLCHAKDAGFTPVCDICNGTGEIYVGVDDGLDRYIDCPNCNGTGTA